MMQNDTYTLTVSCDNCDFIGDVQIQKGKLISEAYCPKCQCQTLSKQGDRNQDQNQSQTLTTEKRKPLSERISDDLGLEETHKSHDRKFGRIGVFKHRPF
ncbi:MAG TPA: hypothetical protein DCX22_00895 [Dehalococcoidia bacterium]|nr:hypothetical protein [Dehalococcoidia bacterium]